MFVHFYLTFLTAILIYLIFKANFRFMLNSVGFTTSHFCSLTREWNKCISYYSSNTMHTYFVSIFFEINLG